MLGRLIDQLFSVHVHEPSEACIIGSFIDSHPHLKQYSPESPWGNTLPLFRTAGLNIINLETSVTASLRKWPDKVFNYRMHPENIKALHPARISYAGLANNHTLDFSEDGLRDTVGALKEANIAFAGAGLSQEEAVAPATVNFQMQLDGKRPAGSNVLKIWAAADHPSDWAKVPGFSFIDYTVTTRQRLKKLILETSNSESNARRPLKIFSVHWGPNYSWQPSEDIKSLAHYLVDECGIDIIHGHSSHHIQGVEIYKGKLIIYGCGDFVDDYAMVPEYRNDLSAVWRVNVIEDGPDLKLDSLGIFPTRIKTFQAQRLELGEADFGWFRERLATLCSEFGTHVGGELGEDNQLVISLTAQQKA